MTPAHNGVVLMLPGRAYTCEMPLLAAIARNLEASGWLVRRARWRPDDVPARPRTFVETAAERLDHGRDADTHVLVVAKSLGTLAAHWAADRGYPAVWLTPVLRPGGLRPLPEESGALAERLRDYPAANLVVGGTADPLWLEGFAGTGSVLEVDGADHGLESQDSRTTLATRTRVTRAVQELTAGIAG